MKTNFNAKCLLTHIVATERKSATPLLTVILFTREIMGHFIFRVSDFLLE